MKFKTIIYTMICILSFDANCSNSQIDKFKKISIDNIAGTKKKFLSIKKKIISPYNKIHFPYESYLDSLHFLSEKLDKQRKRMFSDLIEFDLKNKDIQFFNNLNKEMILLYNVIAGFQRIYHSYLIKGNSYRNYSFEKYTLDMRNFLAMEEKLFLSEFKYTKN